MHVNIAVAKAKLWQYPAWKIGIYGADDISAAESELHEGGYIKDCFQHGTSCVILTRRAMKGD